MFSAGRVLLMPKGAYNPLTTYEMLDIVSYNGSSYIAKGTTTGNLPTDTTYWQLSAYGGQAANIAGNFAELESSSVATATHYVDDIFVDENSQLMKATQTINIGDTIDANVNCAPTTVEALIAYLSSYVDSLDSLNKKIQGAIEIAAQTDLHSLAIGEYYKKQSTFYVTNGPTGIDQDPTAIFRLTVEAALDNASQASSPLLLTLRTPGGVVYTQGFDGTNWGSWVEVASAASVSALNTAKQPKTLDTPITVGGVQQTTVEGALGSINQTLTNKVANEIATRAKVSGHNFVPFPYYTNSIEIAGITWTTYSDGRVKANGTATALSIFDAINTELHSPFSLEQGDYVLTDGLSASDYEMAYSAITLMYSDGTVEYNHADTSIGKNDFAMPAKSSIKQFYLGLCIRSGETVNDLIFKPMIRLATDASPDYEPYAMTNQELTPIAQAVSNRNLLDNPWFTVNQRGLATSLGGYIVDRWNARNTSKLDTISNGIKFTNVQDTDAPTWIRQNIELSTAELLVGKTLTISVMSANGNIFSIPFVLKNTNNDIGSDFSFEGITCRLRYEWQTGFLSFLFYVVHKDDEISLRAFKLELGSVSTLAMDTAPNYQQELAKCQRYFQCLRGSLGMGFFKVADAVECVCPIPVPMRATPTATITNNVGIVADDAYSAYATGINLWGEFPDSCIGFDLTGFSHATGSVCRLFSNNGGAINLSADL